MPPKQEKQQPTQKPKISTAPTQSWWQKLFGSAPMTPEMEQGIRIAKSEMPNMGPVETYGPISQLLMSGANAYTSPGRQIYLNPSKMTGLTPEEIADTLTHEQTHVNQMNERNLNPIMEFLNNTIYGRFPNPSEPYHRRPDEMQAYQAEFERRKRMGRGQEAIPSFLTGQFQTPADISLRSGIDTGPSIEQRQQMLLRRQAGR